MITIIIIYLISAIISLIINRDSILLLDKNKEPIQSSALRLMVLCPLINTLVVIGLGVVFIAGCVKYLIQLINHLLGN